MGVGFELKRILRDRNMTIKQLSSISGISLNTLYSITKRDSVKCDAVIVKTIADALDISPIELYGGVFIGNKEELDTLFPNPSDPESDNNTKSKETYLLEKFNELNENGKIVAIERVEELAEIPKYKKEPPKSDNTPSDE